MLHANGIMGLLRAINLNTPYHGEFKGSINLSQEITDCDLLVVAGRQEFTLADEWIEVLRAFMERWASLTTTTRLISSGTTCLCTARA